MNHELQRVFSDAAWDGDEKTIRFCLNHPDIIPDAFHSCALLHAAHRGKTRCVRLLIPVSDPNSRKAEPLWRAAKHRHKACVRLLAPVSDTTVWEGWAWAELPEQMRGVLALHGHRPPVGANSIPCKSLIGIFDQNRHDDNAARQRG